MLAEKVKEPIKVLAVFDKGSVRPVSFEWRNQKFSDFKIGSSWVGSEGSSRVLFFAILFDGDAYEICFRVRRMTWHLTRIISL